jgi:hypothetical protein
MRRIVALGIAIALAACASSNEPKVSREESQVTSFKARVAAVDQQTRVVTLIGPDGGRTTFRADEAVKNLPQVKVGDEVVGTLVETLLIEVRKPSPDDKATAASVTDVVATAEPGQKPAGLFVRQVQALYTVESIDKAKGGGTLRDASGKSTFVKARDPAVLDRVKVGDTVVVTLTEGLKLEVVTPAP